MKNKHQIARNGLPSAPAELTAKQLAVLDALVTGMNQTQAAEHVGVSREYVCRLCRKDHFLRELDRRIDRAKTLLAPKALAAVARLAESARSERVQLDANLGLLDRAGHGTPNKDKIAFQCGDLQVFIDLS